MKTDPEILLRVLGRYGIGTETVDEEVCGWDEFTIYDGYMNEVEIDDK